MKKILFCLQTMVFGGVETELITVLKRFDPNEYEVSLLLFYEEDLEMIEKIPKGVKIINLNLDKKYYFSNLLGLVKERLKKGQLFSAAGLVLKKVLKIGATAANVDIKNISGINDEYDYAVCYHMHSPIMLRYVAEKVCARKKIAWIHNDFTTTGYQIQKYANWLKCYDAFIGVSDKVSKEFLEKCPVYAGITKTVHNIVDVDEILSKASELSAVEKGFLNDTRFKIVTVGRFVEQKGFDIAIEACNILKSQGIPIAWYAIGYGNLEPNLQQAICDCSLQEEFIILGRKSNPYPYMKLADLYVQPSRHEGYPITLCEAKVLKKVIVCTNFAGASEQITNEKNGVIVPEITAGAVANAIFELYCNESRRAHLQQFIQNQQSEDDWENIKKVFAEG